MPTVRFTRGDAVEIEIPLEARDLRVGRAADNDVVLKDPDKTLSRHHAELRLDGTRWHYLDLNSANGSWMGERRITREELTPGVSVSLGDYFLTVVEPARASAADPADRGDATRLMRADDATLRPDMAPQPAATIAAAGADRRPVVGGAVPAGAARPPAARSSSPPMIRRILIYGSIVVFGAFAFMLALLFRSDPSAPADETAAAAPVAATPAAAPVEPAPAPAPTPEPVAPPAPAPAPTPVEPPVVPAPAKAVERPTPRPAAKRTTPPPRPARDADPDAAAIPAHPGELPADLQERRDDVRRRYNLAVQRLAARQFVAARDLLVGVLKDAPTFRDVAVRLAEAENGVRQQAAEGFKTAARHEESGEWSEALRAYEALRPYAASLPGLAEATERTRKRMYEAGADALTRARQFDSRGRVPEAIAWYQRAVAWLPPDHPGLNDAKQRLAQLVNRP